MSRRLAAPASADAGHRPSARFGSGSGSGPRTAPRSTGCSTWKAASSTSARPSGSGPDCSLTFAPSIPDDKAARILYASNDITWDYTPSEFSAYLGELRQIKQFRPHFNHRGNLTRRAVFIKVSRGPAPRVYAGETVGREDARCYGPFRSLARTGEAVRTLNDLLGLRDCAADDADRLQRPGRSLRRHPAGGVHAPRVRILQRTLRRRS